MDCPRTLSVGGRHDYLSKLLNASSAFHSHFRCAFAMLAHYRTCPRYVAVELQRGEDVTVAAADGGDGKHAVVAGALAADCSIETRANVPHPCTL